MPDGSSKSASAKASKEKSEPAGASEEKPKVDELIIPKSPSKIQVSITPKRNSF